MQGPVEKSIIRQCIAAGRALPKKIAEAPELRTGLELFYLAFFDLIGCRSGMGDGPISWLAMSEYAKFIGLDDEGTEDMIYYVNQMDGAYLKHCREKTPKPGK